jgi:cytidylate kinase
MALNHAGTKQEHSDKPVPLDERSQFNFCAICKNWFYRNDTLKVPTVHLNGTAKSDLVAQLESAIDALFDAERKIAEAEPNGRDFYPQGSNVINQAIAEHVSRLNRIEGVRKELEQILESIQK